MHRKEDWQKQSDIRIEFAKVRIGRLASNQGGQVSRRQLTQLGLGAASIQRGVDSAYLIERAPAVFAVGHVTESAESDLWRAVLYAGPGAEISHATAGWWRNWLQYAPAQIHVSSPRRRASLPRLGIVVHGRRRIERTLVRGVPTTTITQTMLDLAGSAHATLVRKALAELDYQGLLDLDALQAACGPGRAGSTALSEALSRHLPELARTRSELEDRFVLDCEARGLPIPLVNRVVYGVRADCWWPRFRLVVFLDGAAAHSSEERRRRDRAEELALRAHGLAVLRYDATMVDRRMDAIELDLRAQMAAADAGRRAG